MKSVLLAGKPRLGGSGTVMFVSPPMAWLDIKSQPKPEMMPAMRIEAGGLSGSMPRPSSVILNSVPVATVAGSESSAWLPPPGSRMRLPTPPALGAAVAGLLVLSTSYTTASIDALPAICTEWGFGPLIEMTLGPS